MSDLLSKLQSAYDSSSDEDQAVNNGKSKQTTVVNGSNGNGKTNGSSIGNLIHSAVSEPKISDLKQVEKKPLLGKRLLTKRTDDSDEEQEFDLMKMAKQNINQRNAKEQIIKQKNKDNPTQSNEIEAKKLEHIDPATQKLFQMLPPPKKSNQLTLSSALRNDTDILLIKPDSDDDEVNDQDYQDQGRQNVKEIKGSDLVDKDEFYRNQLKKHSLQQFRQQTLNRMRGLDGLADRGKGINHLASLGSDHLDMITQLEDKEQLNKSEYNAKRARYGW